MDSLTGEVIGEREQVSIFPATHFVTNEQIMERALASIKDEMNIQVKKFEGKENF